ncbi:MAG TPA: hypothetical protein VKP10_19175 [Gemmatimonadales bacterium]|nr:hypothetical protein [Gemmatimonadales bacterium]
MRRTLARGMILAGLAAASVSPLACRPHRSAEDEVSAADQGEFVLRVINNHYLDVTVYLLRGAERVRVGIVSGNSRQDFVLSGRLLGPGGQISLLGSVSTSNAVVRSNPVLVGRGEFVEWRLESVLRNSSVTVY